MISVICKSCEKKLTVKDALAGKRVKCPGCGNAVPIPVSVGAATSAASSSKSDSNIQDGRTLPPAERKAAPPKNASLGDKATLSPRSKSDATATPEMEDSEQDTSLIDFLAPAESADELGRLGKYRILKVLGHGGMGVVYKAEDPKLQRAVAVKAMLPALAASASAGKRFLREAQAMAAVEHDHIVRIYQVDEDRGVPFLAMEFLRGEPLDVRLEREAKLPLAEAVRIGIEIAEGLAAAHATGLIHRDIKPANVWLETKAKSAKSAEPAVSCRVKILDFGLARAGSEDSHLTQQGAIVGTPAYMAPEQASGKKIDARCDLFSLGVILYRLTTGTAPFHGTDTVSTLMAVATHDPDPPCDVNPKVPEALSDLIMELLEKDPDRRINSAGEVVRLLRRIDPDDTSKTNDKVRRADTAKKGKARDLTSSEKTTRAFPPLGKEKSKPWIWLAIGGSAAVVLGLVLFLVLRGGNTPADNGTPQQAKGSFVPSPSASPRPSPGPDNPPTKTPTVPPTKEPDNKNSKPKGNLVLTVEPVDGQEIKVFLGDKLHASVKMPDGKPTTMEIDEGSYELKVAKVGYETHSQFLAIKPGESELVTVNLKTEEVKLAKWLQSLKDPNARAPVACRLEDGRITMIQFGPEDPRCTNDVLERLQGLTHLRILKLSSPAVTDAGLKHLRNLKKLNEVDLLLKVSDEGLGYLSGNKDLARLNLDLTLISDKGLAELRAFKKLQYLRLSGTKITGTGLEHLQPLTELLDLSLADTPISDDALDHIAKLKSLYSLNLMITNVSDAGLKKLAPLKKLQTLHLNKTQITDVGVGYLENLNLTQVYLVDTKVTPAAAKKLKMKLPNCYVYLEKGKKI